MFSWKRGKPLTEWFYHTVNVHDNDDDVADPTVRRCTVRIRTLLWSIIILICLLQAGCLMCVPLLCGHQTSSSNVTPAEHVLRLYQYPLESLCAKGEDCSRFHTCGNALYNPRIDDRYALEYILPNKVSKWTALGVRYRIPTSILDDYVQTSATSEMLDVVFTDDPSDADYFIVPQVSACVMHTSNGTLPWADRVRITESYLLRLIEHVIHVLPYWNTTNDVSTPGSNHIFVFTWDRGICLCPAVIRLLRHAIKVQGYGIKTSTLPVETDDYVPSSTDVSRFAYRACFNESTDIVVPQASWTPPLSHLLDPTQQMYIRASPVQRIPFSTPRVDRRETEVFMRGAINFVSCCNITYSNGVRQQLSQIYTEMTERTPNQQALVIKSGTSGAKYAVEMQNARIGICARGWAPWTTRLQDVMNSDTIPLIIADEIVLPYENLLDWRAFAMKINESNLHSLVRQVGILSIGHLQEKQRQLWLHSQYLSWHGDDRFNAFAMMMRTLMLKKMGRNESPFSPVALAEFW